MKELTKGNWNNYSNYLKEAACKIKVYLHKEPVSWMQVNTQPYFARWNSYRYSIYKKDMHYHDGCTISVNKLLNDKEMFDFILESIESLNNNQLRWRRRWHGKRIAPEYLT